MSDPQYPPTGDGTTAPAPPATTTVVGHDTGAPLADTGFDGHDLGIVGVAAVLGGALLVYAAHRLENTRLRRWLVRGER